MTEENAQAIWDELDTLQQDILRNVATISKTASPGGVMTATAFSGLYLIDLLTLVNGADYAITDKGRAVYEAAK